MQHTAAFGPGIPLFADASMWHMSVPEDQCLAPANDDELPQCATFFRHGRIVSSSLTVLLDSWPSSTFTLFELGQCVSFSNTSLTYLSHHASSRQP